MNFYRNRAISQAARGNKSIGDMRDAQPMPPISGRPITTITANLPPKVDLAPEAHAVVSSFDEGTDGLGTYIINNAKEVHIPILNGASSSSEGFSNLLLTLRGEYEELREELREEGGEEGGEEGDGETGRTTDQPTYHMDVAETLIRGWVGSVSRLLKEAEVVSKYNFTAHGAKYCLLHDDIYAVRDILKSLINTASAINSKEGDVFSIERRHVGKIMLDKNFVTCYLLTIKTVVPQDGKVTTEYAEDNFDGVTLTCALMRNGYRWLVLPVNHVGAVINELNPISYSHRVGRNTTKIVFGPLFGHEIISQVFSTASISQLHRNELPKIRF